MLTFPIKKVSPSFKEPVPLTVINVSLVYWNELIKLLLPLTTNNVDQEGNVTPVASAVSIDAPLHPYTSYPFAVAVKVNDCVNGLVNVK